MKNLLQSIGRVGRVVVIAIASFWAAIFAQIPVSLVKLSWK